MHNKLLVSAFSFEHQFYTFQATSPDWYYDYRVITREENYLRAYRQDLASEVEWDGEKSLSIRTDIDSFLVRIILVCRNPNQTDISGMYCLI